MTEQGNATSNQGKVLLCPSARSTFPDSVVISVLGGTAEAPRMVPIERPLPVTAELLEMAGPVEPTEVFRFASRCQTERCSHFQGKQCQLARGGVELLPEVEGGVPYCAIRASCRWFEQEGVAMCKRCPQIVTDQLQPTHAIVQIVTHILPAAPATGLSAQSS